METYTFVAEEKARIDKWMSEQSDWSRSQIQDWIKAGDLLVNGQVVKPNYKLQEGDEIVVTVPEAVELEVLPENIKLDVVYEDEDVIVVNKARGMVVHPAAGHTSGTLVNALLYHCDDLSGINGVKRPGIVHRIDKDTTGLLMVAKNDVAHESLASQLKDRKIKREYIALVHGEVAHELGTIEAPIGRDTNDRQRMTVTDKNAKEAITHFRLLERYKDFTLVECKLETGRTHQIRVHMRYIGHPLAGDPKYGPRRTIQLNGQALHAATLGFFHPRTDEWLEFEAPLPADFEAELAKLDKIEKTR
ncbi:MULTISPECIES: RluA family pseudouridine synthase [Exiguobacterium]|jgi:23S rRNA pseudouridine1911/1915/1917 synthase|uniref:RluA family pseudouridine synthase n=1 Tax=Exiguobacterium TaxID=33986 RepID=UPI00051361B3|nr:MULTISPECIES: RluA family pseudouridine synthase [Exiguobacterium]KGI85071.1 pseudouridine synthase [Exiguobacterium mexicanum]RHB51193.1 RluA family pseudouridine synthase [Exiguobacterium sp. AM39-5BH]